MFLKTPEAITTATRICPGLVMAVINGPRFMILPVTKFNDRRFDRLDLTDKEKKLFLPILPNTKDIVNRAAISTTPTWKAQDAYQMLQTVQVGGLRLENGDHVTYRCDEDDFQRLLSLLAGRGSGNQENTPSISTNTPTISDLSPTAPPFFPRNSYPSPREQYAYTPAMEMTNSQTPVQLTFSRRTIHQQNSTTWNMNILT
jgi:hypothetical protein